MNAENYSWLLDLLRDFETGWISNPGVRGEENRKRHEKRLRKILEGKDGKLLEVMPL